MRAATQSLQSSTATQRNITSNFLAEDNLTELQRLIVSNKKEWQMAHLLGLIIQEENTNKFSVLTKRLYELEKKVVQIEERIMG